jgi:DNA-binding GntR family transcriptional regulator
VVYEKMLAAIVDGTLEPGERLNDDALCAWLGVSRTPVREAITQLHGIGLVEIEANRFTKVASLDDELYAEAAQFLAGLHSLAREWGTRNLDKESRREIQKGLDAAKNQLKAQDIGGAHALLDVQGRLAAASGNALFAGAEEPLRVRVKFLSPREPEGYDWDALMAVADDISAEIKG